LKQFALGAMLPGPMATKTASSKTQLKRYEESIAQDGLRLTRQRKHVYGVLLGRQDHPTAMEVFLRAKPEMESLSLATVYNVLETLAERGLVRKVHLDSGSTRYCANNSKHGHFTCSGCGAVLDVPLLPGAELEKLHQLPRGYTVTQQEVSLHGLCAGCRKNSH
jgi:Fur family peroxide stress response transcriptional regulator